MSVKHKKICITGATGYLASHLICKLLPSNILHVITRNRENFIQHCVPSICAQGSDISNAIINLHIFECDYTNELSIIQALSGCYYLIHCASPVILNAYNDMEANYNNIISPALKITETLLNCVNKTSITTVIYTSSTCAVYSKYKKNMSSMDWGDEVNADPYTLSKILSEKKAWELSKNANWKLIVMLPGRILGPPIYSKLPESYISITEILNSTTELPNYHSSYCDVRDVASIYAGFLETDVPQARYIIAFSVHPLQDYYNAIISVQPLSNKSFIHLDDKFELDMSNTFKIYPITPIPFNTSIQDSLKFIKF